MTLKNLFWLPRRQVQHVFFHNGAMKGGGCTSEAPSMHTTASGKRDRVGTDSLLDFMEESILYIKFLEDCYRKVVQKSGNRISCNMRSLPPSGYTSCLRGTGLWLGRWPLLCCHWWVWENDYQQSRFKESKMKIKGHTDILHYGYYRLVSVLVTV